MMISKRLKTAWDLSRSIEYERFDCWRRAYRSTTVEVLIPPGAKAVGVAIKDLSLPIHCVIAGIIRRGEMIVPRGLTVMGVGDEVLAITDPEGAEQLVEFFTVHHS